MAMRMGILSVFETARTIQDLQPLAREVNEPALCSVAHIIAAARRWNPARGITGLLVCGSGVFFQWIEGPRDNVMQLMDRIRADPRHEHVVTLSETEEVRERLFPEWDMELVSASEIRDVLIDALADAEDEKNTASLSLILEHLDAGGIAELGAVV